MKDSNSRRVVDSDEMAWKVLEDWIKGDPIDAVVFERWPVLAIRISGEDYKSSLNSNQMAAFVDLRFALGRSLAAVVHGAYDMRRLTQEEEASLDFSTKVKHGSSVLETDFTPIVNAFAVAIGQNPSLSLVGAILVGVGLVTRPMVLRYFEEKKQRIESSERQAMMNFALNTSELSKTLIFEKAVKQFERSVPQFPLVMADTRDAFWRLASASTGATEMTVAGITMPRSTIEAIAGVSVPIKEGTERVAGLFFVKSVRKIQARYHVALEGEAFAVTVSYKRPYLTDARISTLTSAMVSEKQVSATLLLSKVKRGKMSGTLLEFSVVEEQEKN